MRIVIYCYTALITLPELLPGNPPFPSGDLPGLRCFERCYGFLPFWGRKSDVADTARTLQMGPGPDFDFFCGFASRKPSGKLPGARVSRFSVFWPLHLGSPGLLWAALGQTIQISKKKSTLKKPSGTPSGKPPFSFRDPSGTAVFCMFKNTWLFQDKYPPIIKWTP